MRRISSSHFSALPKSFERVPTPSLDISRQAAESNTTAPRLILETLLQLNLLKAGRRRGPSSRPPASPEAFPLRLEDARPATASTGSPLRKETVRACGGLASRPDPSKSIKVGV
jgi:hypothetical protein